ncbi:Dot/Icm T4SS effector metaeffector MesI [Legionella quateirensis]|uniref:Ankyrin repeat protein n=1 Tax=Legionella quateirensis TaxID=45072 RepID=A0A378KU64_9GAMM|nr:Dot/Icm T4SS effector metaeffector MesI [Legionella quateirensis]KTD43246.1 Ankyrin repeat protein [Legionella quateirensis]STY18125.1 Ankyrin repeat protein [Legionella quateirensis]
MGFSHVEIKRIDLIASTEQIITDLQKLTPLELALLKATSKSVEAEILDSPQLSVLWVNKFNTLRLQRDSSFQFRDPSPLSRSDFYCGYVLYLAAMKEKGKQNNKYEEYLALSTFKFNSFHASRELLSNLITDCHKISEQNIIDNLNTTTNVLTSNLLKFKTSGCLLLANTYFYLADFYQNLKLENKAIDCYKKCWELIHLAGLWEEYSETQIHNTYFGHGIKMSNGFGLSTINKIKDHFLKRCSEALPYTLRHNLEMQALKEFETQMQQEPNCMPQFDDQPCVKGGCSSSRGV